jgi:hypothetical protein
MLTNPYLNYNEVLSFNVRHHFLVGDRGIGKTYGITRWLLGRAIHHGEPFIWSRNTKTATDRLLEFNAMGFLANHPKKMGLEPADFRVEKQSLFFGDTLIGSFIPLSIFFGIKGINYDEYINFVFDEFMPERREANRIDTDYALKSVLQTVFRERTNFRAFYTANVLHSSCTSLDFFSFSITPTFPEQKKQLNKKLSGIIFYLQNLKPTLDKDKIKGDAFALANKHTESSLVIDYEKNIDKDCAKDMKRSQRMVYLAGDQTYFLLREYKNKVAVIPVKKPGDDSDLPIYALNKKFVFGVAIFDIKMKQQLTTMWNSNSLIFKSHYALYQFINGLFAQ